MYRQNRENKIIRFTRTKTCLSESHERKVGFRADDDRDGVLLRVEQHDEHRRAGLPREINRESKSRIFATLEWMSPEV